MKKYCLPLLFVFLSAFHCTFLLAQDRVYKGIIPNPTVTPALTFANGGPALVIKDLVYADPSLRSQIGTPRKMQNIVMLKINEESNTFISSDFTVSVPLKIIKIPIGGGDPIEVTKTLSLSYKIGAGQKSDAATYYVVDDGGYELSVAINGDIVKNVSWDVTSVLQIVSEIRSAYDAPFNHGSAVTQLADNNPGGSSPFDELRISWAYPASTSSGTFNSFPTGYDIEWAWVDEDAVENYKTNNNWDASKIFLNNETRTTVPISCNHYDVPLFYDGKGWIFYRVRAVQVKLDGQVINGDWSTSLSTSSGGYHYMEGHERALNWQVSTSYAEEGKRKTVIQYFDGTLRGRQTVTKDNSNGTTVVAETFYDYNGRPTIQVLPAPTLSTVISFTKNFNNNNIDNIGYPKELYDLLQTGQSVCDGGAPPLNRVIAANGAHGAGNYYSSQNPLVNSGFNKFIPEANGFAFAETRYTPDATGRIAAQGGVGVAHQIGSGHETKYYYGAPTQDELDMLFGTDAGISSHYQKTVVKDANGQFSVSYTDMYGRTVATALAGESLSSLSELPSLKELKQAALPAVKKQLLDEQTNVVDGRSITMVKELLVTSPGIRHFEYQLDPKQLQLENCQSQLICYDCLYDLKITISNNCNNKGLPNDEPFVITRKNFSLPYNSVCNEDPQNIEFNFDVDISETGSYTITKVLTLSKEAQDQFRENAMQNGILVCETKESIYNEIKNAMAQGNENCQPTCATCETLIGNSINDGFRQRFMAGANILEADMPLYEESLNLAYQQAKAECEAICENGSDRVNNYKQILLMDMMPDRGQYARILRDDMVDANGVAVTSVDITAREYNIFYSDPLRGSMPYKQPKKENGENGFYLDATGNIDVEAQQHLADWSPKQFTENFKESWADQLIVYHPEFKKFELVNSVEVRTAFRWQEQVQGKDHWSEVSATMTGLPASDPFYTLLPTNSTVKTSFNGKINEYMQVENVSLSMWQLAVATLKCRSASDELNCLKNSGAYKVIGTFPPEISCDADKDIVWKIFNGLYFSEREKAIQSYLQEMAPVPASLFAKPTNPAFIQYQERFINPGSTAILNYLPGELTNVYNAATQTGNSSSATAAMDQQFEDNCRSYATQWLQKMEAFNQCKPGITDAQYNALIEELVSVCKRGSDIQHPLGSSSVAPGKEISSVPSTFEEAIEKFMFENQIDKSIQCHPYVIDWPKPYENSPSFDNEQIWEAKPDDCVCSRLTEITSAHNAALLNGSFTGSLSHFFKTRYGTEISESTLTQLKNACESTNSTCQFLSEPIVIPPALQCNGPKEVCIDCGKYNSWKSQFLDMFNAALPQGIDIPIANPVNETELSWNKTFADYLNYRSGFSKQWNEYLSFQRSCEIASDTAGVCSKLADIKNSFVGDTASSIDCSSQFTHHFNEVMGTMLNYGQIQRLYFNCTGSCLFISCCTNCMPPDSTGGHFVPCGEPMNPYLCGLNLPLTPKYEIVEDDPCDDYLQFSSNASIEAYNLYIEKTKDDFDKAYLEKCLAVQELESFTVEAPTEREYHYTLYYYDQSGNLVQTVPPAGVDNFNNQAAIRDAFLSDVKSNRINGAAKKPYHRLLTKYRYNTLGQVVEQESPDGGLSQFWYDELGRLVVSQNAKQANANAYSYTRYDELGRITEVGQKPTSVPIDQSTSRDAVQLKNWLDNTGSLKEQITKTVYDVSYSESALAGLLVQRNLRNRVSFTQVIPEEPADFQTNPNAWITKQSAGTYYTYDIHGSVDELVQEFNEGPMKTVNNGANRFKKLAYTYDLVSGKVNKVIYQPDYYVDGELKRHIDRFYHRYGYDAENKLTKVETSHDGIIWETDARYKYYKHGPLARMVLGQQEVQGVDYAYTLQGWMKGVNSSAVSATASEGCATGSGYDVMDVSSRQQYGRPTLYTARQVINFEPGFDSDLPDDFTAEINPGLNNCTPAGGSYIAGDMGEDGDAGSTGKHIARDAYGFVLNYYETPVGIKDYTAINENVTPFAGGMFNLPNSDGQQVAKPLFNGNIASMFVNIPKLGMPLLYGYQYDQLNRIVGMDAFGGFSSSSNQWTNSPQPSPNYKERVSYDGNGNILAYLRHGDNGVMDDLYYQYPKYNRSESGTNDEERKLGRITNNRLRFVQDDVDKNAYTGIDIDNQTTIGRADLETNEDYYTREQASDNYVYDEIGNLVKDVKEGISSIEWNLYGKIKKITKTKDLGTTIETTIIEYTYDASGNRIGKAVQVGAGAVKSTWYVRDANGNVMAVYENNNSGINDNKLSQVEVHLYGSSRLGLWNAKRNVEDTYGPGTDIAVGFIRNFSRGDKVFELSNHLGNVLVTVSDKNIAFDNDSNGEIDYRLADVLTANDYYPFGMGMHNRTYSASSAYRYGFNGKENDNEIKGEGNHQDYGMRVYDPRIGRFLSEDPLTQEYPWFTPFQFAGNMPIWAIDIDGMEGDKQPNGNENKTEKEKEYDANMNNLVSKLDNMLLGGKGNHDKNVNRLRGALASKREEIVELKEKWSTKFTELLNIENKLSVESSEITKELVDIDNQVKSKIELYKFISLQLYKEADKGINIEVYNKWVDAQLRSLHYGTSSMVIAASFIPSAGASTGFFLTRPAAGRVFWSGGTSAGKEAALFAGQRGMQTLEMTMKGRLLTGLTKLTSYKLTRPLWEMASRSFARGAKGEAHVFLNFNKLRSTSTWLKFERPILENRGINIITHPIK
jgi:RHS repeat-associated protein